MESALNQAVNVIQVGPEMIALLRCVQMSVNLMENVSMVLAYAILASVG